MATIRKHREKFQVRIRRKDATPITRSFTTYADAKEWATLQERKADRGELGADRKELERITLAKLVERYRDEVVSTKKAATVERYILNAFLRHSICKKRLSDITVSDFAAYRDERLRQISAASLKRQLTPIRNMFEIARAEWDVPLASNPLSRLTLKARDNKRERRLDNGDYGRLVKALAKTRNPLLGPIIRLALSTAMRRGEILALRLRDVDVGRRTAMIREAKNGHSRTIPLTDEAARAISDAIAISLPDRNELVFPMKPAALREAWDSLVERAGLEDLHFHDLRHEAISRLFEAGLTVPEVASVSGHRTLSQLMRYAHANSSVLRAKMGRVIAI